VRLCIYLSLFTYVCVFVGQCTFSIVPVLKRKIKCAMQVDLD